MKTFWALLLLFPAMVLAQAPEPGGGASSSIVDGDTSAQAIDATPAIEFDLNGTLTMDLDGSLGRLELLNDTGFATYNASSQRHGLFVSMTTNPQLLLYRAGTAYFDSSYDGVVARHGVGPSNGTGAFHAIGTDTGAADGRAGIEFSGWASAAPTSGTASYGIRYGKAYVTTQSFAPASGSVERVAHLFLDTINQSGTATGDYALIRGNVTETSFLGTTGLVLDLQVDASAVFSVDNSGIVQEVTPVSGTLYEDDLGGGTTDITVTTAGTYYGWVTASAGTVSGGVTADVTVTAGEPGDKLTVPAGLYEAEAALSFSGTANAEMFCCIHDDGTRTTVCLERTLGAAGVSGNASTGSGHLSIAADSAIDLRCTSDGNGDTIAVRAGRLSLVRLGPQP